MAASAIRSKTLGFVGLGRMGFEMARNLYSKQPLGIGSAFVVCDANAAVAHDFAQRFRSLHPQNSITVASTPAEVVRAAQTIFTVLPSTPQVEQVYTQGGGVLEALQAMQRERADTLCIDSTTLDVEYARQVASLVTDAGAAMIDAPVSGGVVGATAGTLSFLVGGRPETLQVAQPYLQAMGKRIIHCGDSGAGLAAKLCNNLILGIQQVAVAEAMLLGEALGLDPATLASVLNSSTAACWSSKTNCPVPAAVPDQSPPSARDFEGGFATQLMLKDMNLATQAAAAADSPMPLGEATKYLYEAVVGHDSGRLAKKDFSVVWQFLREVNSEVEHEEERD
ncbi:3-hydroxyisobutyrate dehydrogenase [Auriculariales sp. MPI-PUGE-AT-0066]|nr:3-hydroxyisobutyrate dehydrogenase [Auriculariales sp. MPI-PUGE-AT-0066]